MFIDTHAHLQFKSFDEDREMVIQRAIENDVAAMITIGTDLTSSLQAVDLAEKYAAVYAAVGIHPTDCAEVADHDFDRIQELATHPKVVAIGEVGLDYYHMRATREKQKNAFVYQIHMAKELKKPLIIHNRESHQDMYEILAEQNLADLGAVLHSFSGDDAFFRKIMELDLYISFTGNITFKKSTSDQLVVQAPLERLLLETDSPFLTPAPFRGKRNEPAYVVHTARKIADLKEIPVEEVARVTSENAVSFFKLDL